MLHRALIVVPVVLLAVAPVAAVASTSSPPVRCRGLVATIVGTPDDDRLVGTPGRDVIAARGGDDRVDGRGGDDVVCGGGGSDTLVGGRGDDRLYGGRDSREQHGRRVVVEGDLLEGGPGDDLLDARPTSRPASLIKALDRISFEHSRHPVRVDLARGTARGEGHDTIVAQRWLEVRGSAYDDVLLGSGRSETLDGLRGDDLVAGRGGADAVLGYRGDDVLDGGDGRDLVIGTAGRGTLRGGAGADTIIAGSPRPTEVLGGPGFDMISRSLWGGPTGTIDGGPGRNQLELSPQVLDDEGDGASGVVEVGAGTAVLTWGSRSRQVEFVGITSFTLWGGESWTFRGTDERDFVQVLDARLDAQTFGGDDTVLGGDRNDTIDAGDGTDSVWGGGGRNTCLNAEKGDCDGYPTYPSRTSSARTSATAVLAWVAGQSPPPT